MTDSTAEASTCEWCRNGTSHVADDHPLPRNHPDYHAFYDATDGELIEMLPAFPSPKE